MKCLSEFKKLFFLLIIILNTNLFHCDNIIVNKTTHNSQNTSACSEDECGTKSSTNHIRDHHLLFVDYLKESSSVSTYSDRLRHLSILYGIILRAQENELNQRCYNEIMQIYNGINHKEIWAIKGEFYVVT